MKGMIESIKEGVSKKGELFWKVTFKGDINIYYVFEKSIIEGFKVGDEVDFLASRNGDFIHIKYMKKSFQKDHYTPSLIVQHKVGDY